MRVALAERDEVRAAGLAQDRVKPLLELVGFRAAAIRAVKLGVQFGHTLRQPDEPLFAEALLRECREEHVGDLLHTRIQGEIDTRSAASS